MKRRGGGGTPPSPRPGQAVRRARIQFSNSTGAANAAPVAVIGSE
ncbi:MAG: hypothetical protein RJA24_299, partial [Pseudomonadota bacterium]